jgi:hypothetical protein
MSTETLIFPDEGALGAPKRVGLRTILLIEILFKCIKYGLSQLVYDYGARYTQLQNKYLVYLQNVCKYTTFSHQLIA